MPAPPANLVSALREGAVARHFLFKLGHSQGDVLAWDGEGQIVFNGDTYTSLAGKVRLDGLTDTQQLQSNEIIAELNFVPLDDMTDVDTDIRGDKAEIYVVHIDASGKIVFSQLFAEGEGDYLRMKWEGRFVTLIAHIRSKVSSWGEAPGAYWTAAEQREDFPTDTGLGFMRRLENYVLTGWAIEAEAEDTKIEWDPTNDVFRRVDTNAIIVSRTQGLDYLVSPSNNAVRALNNRTFIAEQDSGAAVYRNAITNRMTVLSGGNDVGIDVNTDLQTEGGKFVSASGFDTVGSRLFELPAIGSNGTATSRTLSINSGRLIKTGSTTGIANTSVNFDGAFNIIIDNRNGIVSAATNVTKNGVVYVEDTTNTPVTFTSGLLSVGGSSCRVSTTGVILTPAGNRIKPTGGNSSTHYLRTAV